MSSTLTQPTMRRCFGCSNDTQEGIPRISFYGSNSCKFKKLLVCEPIVLGGGELHAGGRSSWYRLIWRGLLPGVVHVLARDRVHVAQQFANGGIGRAAELLGAGGNKEFDHYRYPRRRMSGLSPWASSSGSCS